MMLTRDLQTLFSDSVFPREKRFGPNEFVIRQGSPVQGIYALLEGRVKLERYTPEGKAAVMHVARAGESFAEAALFSETYHCYALAVEPARVLLFPREAVLKTLQENPGTALKYIALLSNYVRNLRTNLELRSILSARERILQYLLLVVDPATRTLALNGTLKDLAAHLGLAHETLYRELRKLEQEGVIERGRKTITLYAVI
jgi:CRP-like cAMP-binding protein